MLSHMLLSTVVSPGDGQPYCITTVYDAC